MRTYIAIIVTLIIISSVSCRKDFDYASSNGRLEFSSDTIYLDTIFTNIRSSTRTLKVYNRNRDDVEIPSIQLAKGLKSKYRLNVDGVAGKSFQNIPVLAQDSLFIFIETTIDSSFTQNSFEYSDVIEFDSGPQKQEIQLITHVKDAIFLFPKSNQDGLKEMVTIGYDNNGNEIKTEGITLSNDQLYFSNSKPYVIYGYAAVPSGKELTIEAGSRIHFHANSGIVVPADARINIEGLLSEDQPILENQVVFEGDRLEEEFTNTPGQWGGIRLLAGSSANINFLTIKNATIGIYNEGNETLQSPTLFLKNTQIYNSSSVNLWAKTGNIHAENVVFGNAGNISLYCNLGGSYHFIHCTIANYWNNGFRNGKALEIDNYLVNTASDLIEANFTNSIIDGNNFLELELRANEVNSFNYQFKNCLLKFKDDHNTFLNNPLYNFEDQIRYIELIQNGNADFQDANKNNFNIESTSAAVDQADRDEAQNTPLDILGNDRTQSPAIGAYQVEQQN